MFYHIHRLGISLVVLIALVIPSFAQNATPAPKGPASSSKTSAMPATKSDAKPDVTTDAAAISAYPIGVAELMTSMNSAVTASQTAVDLGRTAARLKTIRSALTTVILTSKEPTQLPLYPEALLCDVRADPAILSAYRGYVTSVINGVQSTASAKPITSLGGAIVSLFEDYTVKISDTAQADNLQKAVIAWCRADFSKFAATYYGEPPLGTGPRAVALAFDTVVAAIIPLVSALNAIVSPIASTIDVQRRKHAIFDYFADRGHRTKLIKALTEITTQTSQFVESQRLQSVGQFVEQIDALQSSKIDPSKIPACENVWNRGLWPAAQGTDPRQRPDFIRCFSAVWKPLSDAVASALKSADQYDQFADASPRDKNGQPILAMTKLEKQLDDIAANKPSAKEVLEEVILYAGIANNVASALSPDNRKKLNDSIDQLVKAF